MSFASTNFFQPVSKAPDKYDTFRENIPESAKITNFDYNDKFGRDSKDGKATIVSFESGNFFFYEPKV